jgi:hypothetical protein
VSAATSLGTRLAVNVSPTPLKGFPSSRRRRRCLGEQAVPPQSSSAKPEPESLVKTSKTSSKREAGVAALSARGNLRVSFGIRHFRIVIYHSAHESHKPK